MFDMPEKNYDDDGNMINEPNPVYPVIFLEIEPGERGHDNGYRYLVEQLDEDVSYFRDFESAKAFIIREGLDIVSMDDMDSMRQRGDCY